MSEPVDTSTEHARLMAGWLAKTADDGEEAAELLLAITAERDALRREFLRMCPVLVEKP